MAPEFLGVDVIGCLFAASVFLTIGCAKDASVNAPGSGDGGASTGGTGIGGVMGGGATGAGGPGTDGGAGLGGAGTGGSASGVPFKAFGCPPGPFTLPVITGLTPTKIAGVPPPDAFNNNGNNFSIIEGPVWIGDSLYVSETQVGSSPPPSRILRVTADGGVTVALDNAGANGMAVDKAGNLVVCNHKDGAITRFNLPAFTATQIVATYAGARFDSPNDLTFRADGNLYFTDPDLQAPSPRPQAKTRIYRLAPGAVSATVVDENRSGPNGVTLSPDGRILYVSGQDGLFRYPVAADGAVGTGTKIVQSIGAGDGMAVDCAGNLYVPTNNTLVVVDPNGNVLGTITVPGIQALTNAAFGGVGHDVLYVGALGSGTQSGLFAIALKVPGYPY